MPAAFQGDCLSPDRSSRPLVPRGHSAYVFDMGKEPAKPRSEPPAPKALEPTTPSRPKEIGGPKGLEPTRYGDWERNGRVSDF